MDKLKAIVVDDEVSILEAVKAILQAEGLQIFTTTSSLTALEQLRNDTFDIIISDLKMPEMDGLELFDRVKEVSPDSLFIMITAFATVASAVDAIKRGMYDYIPKPFTPDEVARARAERVVDLPARRAVLFDAIRASAP